MCTIVIVVHMELIPTPGVGFNCAGPELNSTGRTIHYISCYTERNFAKYFNIIYNAMIVVPSLFISVIKNAAKRDTPGPSYQIN